LGEGFCKDCKPRILKKEPVFWSQEANWPNASYDSLIYFIQEQSELKAIKIGKSDNLMSRLSGLQTANPYELVVLHTIEAKACFELELHEYFKMYRIRGEWFRPTQEIIEFIDNAKNDEYPEKISNILKSYYGT